jgi:hypothetical protein
MEIGLEVNTERTKYMLLSHHQNAEQKHDIKIGNRCFENVAQFLGTTITNQNLIEEEIKRRLNSGNACCHSVQNLLSSCMLSIGDFSRRAHSSMSDDEITHLHYSLTHGAEPFLRSRQWCSHSITSQLVFYGEELLAPCPTPKLEGHPMSALRDCLFNIFAATLHTWRVVPPSAT